MAECTEYIQIIVSGAEGNEAVVNGTYIPAPGVAGVGTRDNTVFTKDGLNSYPRIDVSGSDPGQWFIYAGYPFPTASTYYAPPGSYGESDCPVGFEWTVGFFGSAPVPTVTGVGQPPIILGGSGGGGDLSDPITNRNDKYSTATEAGAVRFRRLVNLGYV